MCLQGSLGRVPSPVGVTIEVSGKVRGGTGGRGRVGAGVELSSNWTEVEGPGWQSV